LNLKFGQQGLRNTRTGEVRVIEFNDYRVVIDPDVKTNASNAPGMTSTLELIRNPTLRHMGELGWRLGLGVSAINLMLLALALSTSNPRVGRSYHTALALLIFVVYYNMINVGQTWVSSGRFSFTGFLVVLHGGVFVLALLWIAARHMNLSWRSLLTLGRLTARARA
jgi:lipopolysaccharide export system permease protein